MDTAHSESTGSKDESISSTNVVWVAIYKIGTDVFDEELEFFIRLKEQAANTSLQATMYALANLFLLAPMHIAYERTMQIDPELTPHLSGELELLDGSRLPIAVIGGKIFEEAFRRQDIH